MEEIVFSKYSVDFTRTALDFCAIAEKAKEGTKQDFVDAMTKVLPLLYIKISVIPPLKENYGSELGYKVTEEMYEEVQNSVENLLGEDNMYLETFTAGMELSDTPIAVKISEDIADIYQDLGNFLHVFKNGKKETMNDSLELCIENFKEYWGQKLLNALRALHHIKMDLKS